MLWGNAVSKCMIRSVAVLSALLLASTGCTQADEPTCTNLLSKSHGNSASCVVVNQGNVLIVTLLGGSVAFPEESPNGRESALCAAERAVWTQAGLSVEASNLLAKFDDGAHLYQCKVLLGSDLDVKRQMGIIDVRWVPIPQLRNLRWQNYEQSSLALDLIAGN